MGYNLDNRSQCGSEFEKAMIKYIRKILKCIPKLKYIHIFFIFRASELDFLRVVKPWIYPNIMFSLYLKLKGDSNVFNNLYKLPLKVCFKLKFKELKM